MQACPLRAPPSLRHAASVCSGKKPAPAALACAGRALDALSALGVKARLIGSLAAELSRFRSDSDIDILVEDRNGIEPTTLFLETEKKIDGLPFDPLFLETVPQDMRQFL